MLFSWRVGAGIGSLFVPDEPRPDRMRAQRGPDPRTRNPDAGSTAAASVVTFSLDHMITFARSHGRSECSLRVRESLSW